MYSGMSFDWSSSEGVFYYKAKFDTNGDAGTDSGSLKVNLGNGNYFELIADTGSGGSYRMTDNSDGSYNYPDDFSEYTGVNPANWHNLYIEIQPDRSINVYIWPAGNSKPSSPQISRTLKAGQEATGSSVDSINLATNHIDEAGTNYTPSYTLSGTVTDGSGNVVGAADVTVTDSTGATIATTTTDAGGDYSVTVTDGTDATVEVSKPGYKTASKTTTVSGATTLNLTMPQSDQTTFVLDDQTQRDLFPADQTKLVVEKRSSLRPPYTYETVASETFGSDEEVTTNLKLGSKYRVEVKAPGSSLSWRGWQYTQNTPDVIRITPTGPSKYITNQTEPTPTPTQEPITPEPTPTPADGGFITPEPTPTQAPITPEPTPTPADDEFVTPTPITPEPTPTQAPIDGSTPATATPTPVTTRDYPYKEGYAWATRRCRMPDGSPGLYIEYYDSDRETTRISTTAGLTDAQGSPDVTIDKTFVEPIGYWSSCIAIDEFPDAPEPTPEPDPSEPTPTLAPGATPTPTEDDGFLDPSTPTEGDEFTTATPIDSGDICDTATVQFKAYNSSGGTVANGTQECRDDLPPADSGWNTTDPTPTNGTAVGGGAGGGAIIGDDAGSGASPLLIGVPAVGAIGLALYRRYQGGGGAGGAGNAGAP
ncbi:carboxypeptidase-like regulatory domain-containing protein [Haloarcula halophila]|uniref:carboxypeptidase-like regulatory domain-containing protein n=1 Tax=Haloarcula TaxID=2237 RepID=UPI003608F1DC